MPALRSPHAKTSAKFDLYCDRTKCQVRQSRCRLLRGTRRMMYVRQDMLHSGKYDVIKQLHPFGVSPCDMKLHNEIGIRILLPPIRFALSYCPCSVIPKWKHAVRISAGVALCHPILAEPVAKRELDAPHPQRWSISLQPPPLHCLHYFSAPGTLVDASG